MLEYLSNFSFLLNYLYLSIFYLYKLINGGIFKILLNSYLFINRLRICWSNLSPNNLLIFERNCLGSLLRNSIFLVAKRNFRRIKPTISKFLSSRHSFRVTYFLPGINACYLFLPSDVFDIFFSMIPRFFNNQSCFAVYLLR